MDTMSLYRLLSVVAVALFASAEAQLCPNDWVYFEKSCYVFIDEVVPWTSAVTFCNILNARLLEVETEAENDFISAQIRSRSGINGAWTGLNDLVREGRWVWASNGQEPSYFNWLPNEPNNNQHGTENGEDCVYILADGRWDDLWCETFDAAQYKPSPVCELPAAEHEIVG